VCGFKEIRETRNLLEYINNQGDEAMSEFLKFFGENPIKTILAIWFFGLALASAARMLRR
jgi:hypothetical protein